MGSCYGSKRDIDFNSYALVRKISIKPSQFVTQTHNNFSHFYKIGQQLGGGNS